MEQLDSVTGAIVENVDNTIRRIEIIAAYQLGQAKNTLTHVYWSATNPKNICFVEYKHKVFRAKVVKLEAHTKAAKVGCLPFSLSFYQMLLKSRYPVLVLSLELKAFKDIYESITWRYSSKYVPLTSL